MLVRYELDWACPDDEEVVKETMRLLGRRGIAVHRVMITMTVVAYCVELKDPGRQILEIHSTLEKSLTGHPAFPDRVGLVLEPSEYAEELGVEHCLTVYNCYLE